MLLRETRPSCQRPSHEPLAGAVTTGTLCLAQPRPQTPSRKAGAQDKAHRGPDGLARRPLSHSGGGSQPGAGLASDQLFSFLSRSLRLSPLYLVVVVWLQQPWLVLL